MNKWIIGKNLKHMQKQSLGRFLNEKLRRNDLFIQTNLVLLADLFENFRNTCLQMNLFMKNFFQLLD